MYIYKKKTIKKYNWLFYLKRFVLVIVDFDRP